MYNNDAGIVMEYNDYAYQLAQFLDGFLQVYHA